MIELYDIIVSMTDGKKVTSTTTSLHLKQALSLMSYSNGGTHPDPSHAPKNVCGKQIEPRLACHFGPTCAITDLGRGTIAKTITCQKAVNLFPWAYHRCAFYFPTADVSPRNWFRGDLVQRKKPSNHALERTPRKLCCLCAMGHVGSRF